MLRGIYGDDERYKQVYWSRFPDLYFTGDGCKVDDDGYFWLMGRVDDIMLVAGHNISTAEVESALVSHEAVAESAVVGRPDPIKGQGISAFVTLKQGVDSSAALLQELREHVATKIGPIAKPDEIHFTADLPKTRSGKIMRRLLRDIAGRQGARRHDHARRPERRGLPARAVRDAGVVAPARVPSGGPPSPETAARPQFRTANIHSRPDFSAFAPTPALRDIGRVRCRESRKIGSGVDVRYLRRKIIT